MSDLIIFECPFCQQSLDAPEEFAGKDARCPACQHAVLIPAVYERPGATSTGEELPEGIQSSTIQEEDGLKSSTIRIDIGEELNLPKAKPRVYKIKRPGDSK